MGDPLRIKKTLPPLIFLFLLLAQRIHAMEEVLPVPCPHMLCFHMLCFHMLCRVVPSHVVPCCNACQAGKTGHQVSLYKRLRNFIMDTTHALACVQQLLTHTRHVRPRR